MTFRFIFIALSALPTLNTHAEWPSFLGGTDRDSVVDFAPPTQWSPDQNVAWKSSLAGHGQSSPVIVGDNIYVTAVDGPMKESNLVACYSLADGSEKWQKTFASSLQVKNDYYTSRAAPSPAADSDGVYAFFESGNLIALSPTGDVRWERDLIADYGKYEGRFGLGGSLAQTADRLFVLADNDGPAYVAAIDKSTGETIWKTDRTPRISWSSPMLIPVGDTMQLVVSSSGSIDGYGIDDGKLLWTYDEVGGNTVASPIAAGNGQFLVGASPGRNGENAEGAKESNLLMRVNQTADGFEPEVVWRNTAATSSFGSPIVYRGLAYYTNRAGVVYCIDVETGETAYTQRLPESNWATPVGIGEHIYIFGKDGITAVIATGPEFKLVAENQLYENESADDGRGNFGAEIQYGFAPLPDGFVVRTGSRLIRIQ